MIEISVPATTANFGPAFDAAGMALDLRMRAVAKPGAQGLRLRVSGPEAPTHDGLAQCIRKGMSLVTPDADSLRLDVIITNDIPLGLGLGSSAAALVCGIELAALTIGHRLDDLEVVQLAARAEGHPDNVAPAVLGGMCFVVTDGADVVVQRVDVPQTLRLAAVVPSAPLATWMSRAALPATYRREDVAYNLQRTALLAAAFASGDLLSLGSALHDRLHERFRSQLMPGLADALAVDAAGALGTVLSGAGPSVLVLALGDPAPAAERVAQAFREGGTDVRILFPSPDNAGVRVEKSHVAA
jgi:homoserine kinase